MSDCSTAAMKPKMPPKTCGTCGRWTEIPLSGEDIEEGERIGVCQCCWMADLSRESRPLFGGLEPGDCFCNGEFWTPLADDLEPDCDACPERIMEDGRKVKARCYDLGQRCQQLEQVTKELFDAYRRLLACYRGAVGLFNAQENATPAGKFREQLEAMGVSVDGD